MPPDQRDFLLVLAAAAHRRFRERAAAITGQLPGHELQIREDFVVVLTGPEGTLEQTPVAVVANGPEVLTTIDGRAHRITLGGALRDLVVRGEYDGTPYCAQLERVGLDYRIAHNGAAITARVLAPRAAELLSLMPVKAPPDLSKFLLSPMPGLLVEVAVRPGQLVLAGEKLAVIEAMKMENILFASQDGVVAEVAARKGDSLAVDQVILRFE